jgi:hypothetical protein
MNSATSSKRVVATVSLGLLAGLLGTATGHGQERRASPLDPARVEFVMGNLQFTLRHELAHVAIWDMKIPIIGPEEQAADYLAVLTLLRPIVKRPQATEAWLRFALTTADAFVILWQAAEEAGAAAPYWDSHGLSIQRYYGITCLIYGSDRQRFASLPALAQMPPQQSANCEAEYVRASESLDWLVAFASDARRGSKKPSMSVEYEPVKTRTSEHLVAELRSRELIEWTVERFGELVALSDDAKVVLRPCSMPEAAWVAETRELIICYELLDLYYLLSAEQHRDEIEALIRN